MNRKKYCDLALSIAGMIIFAIFVIITLIGTIAVFGFMSATFSRVEAIKALQLIVAIVLIIILGLMVTGLILSVRICMLTATKKGASKGLLIAMIVVCSIVALFYFISIFSQNGAINLLWFFLFAGLITASSFSLAIGNAPEQAVAATVDTAAQQQKPATIDEKIAELKRLKELCVITEEQYQEAIKKLIETSSQ